MTEYIADWIKLHHEIFKLVVDEYKEESLSVTDMKDIATGMFIEANKVWSGNLVHDDIQLFDDKNTEFKTADTRPPLPKNETRVQDAATESEPKDLDGKPNKSLGNELVDKTKGKSWLWAKHIFPYYEQHGINKNTTKLWELPEDIQKELLDIIDEAEAASY